MLETGGDLDLPKEPFGAERGCELRVEHFDRDGPPVFPILCEEHRRHAPATELPLDRIAVGEGVAQGVEELGHGSEGLGYSAAEVIASAQ